MILSAKYREQRKRLMARYRCLLRQLGASWREDNPHLRARGKTLRELTNRELGGVILEMDLELMRRHMVP